MTMVLAGMLFSRAPPCDYTAASWPLCPYPRRTKRGWRERNETVADVTDRARTLQEGQFQEGSELLIFKRVRVVERTVRPSYRGSTGLTQSSVPARENSMTVSEG